MLLSLVYQSSKPASTPLWICASHRPSQPRSSLLLPLATLHKGHKGHCVRQSSVSLILVALTQGASQSLARVTPSLCQLPSCHLPIQAALECIECQVKPGRITVRLAVDALPPPLKPVGILIEAPH